METNREQIKSYLTGRYDSFPGKAIPGGLIDEAVNYIPERLAGKFSVLFVQSPADWKRVTEDIEKAVNKWEEGNRPEATLLFIKVVLDTCI